MRIGVVDSGVGGITTLKILADSIPAHYYYYMDNVHVPYGEKSPRSLLDIAVHIMDIFRNMNVDIVVIACNTLSAVTGDVLRRLYSMPIVCIEPSILPAMRAGGKTLVIATPNTVRSDKFLHLVRGHSNIDIFASRSLASYIENNDMENAQNDIDRILAGGKYENVVLGCTHYVFMREYIESRGYAVFEGNVGVKNRVLSLANSMNIYHENDENNVPLIAIHTTKSVDISRIASYLHRPIKFW